MTCSPPGRLRVSDLITQSFAIDHADEAFRLLKERTEPCLAIRLTYPVTTGPDHPVRIKRSAADSSRAGVGWVEPALFPPRRCCPRSGRLVSSVS